MAEQGPGRTARPNGGWAAGTRLLRGQVGGVTRVQVGDVSVGFDESSTWPPFLIVFCPTATQSDLAPLAAQLRP